MSVARPPVPGGLADKGTKGKRARLVSIISEIRPLVQRRLDSISDDPMARLFTGPRGGWISTAVLRDATHLRRNSPQVPNLVYKRARDRNEHAMKAAAAELANVALLRLGGGFA